MAVKQLTFIAAVLTCIILLLAGLSLAKVQGHLLPQSAQPVIKEKTINLADLTLEQKIAQMIVVHGGMHNLEQWKKLQVGGIHLFAMQSEDLYKETIATFQKDMAIPFFVTIDFEGCQNPFAAFKQTPALKNITTLEQARTKGEQDAAYLQELGFSINFAPVVDLEDDIWGCRAFPGNATQIANLAQAYIEGLNKHNILATAKHYPGKTLIIKDPHKHIVAASIDAQDLVPYHYLSQKNISHAVMVSHIITGGAINSQGLPSSGSKEVIMQLRKEFAGIIITDEINMLGLKNYYTSLDQLYLDVVAAGNTLIINFNEDPNEIYHMIQVIKAAVLRGDIKEDDIDQRVTILLEAKGFKVKNLSY